MDLNEMKHETENNPTLNVKIMKPIPEELRTKLREPFPKEALGTIASKTYLTSIKAMYVIERLNDVFGIGRWTLLHNIIKEQDEQVLICGNLQILDYDCEIPEQYGSHKIKGKGVDLADGYKSAITDCITKCASYLEVGIDVFKGKVNPPKTGNPQNKTTDDSEPENPWLNVYNKKDKPESGFTDEFKECYKSMHNGVENKKGEIVKLTLKHVRMKFKVSKDTAERLENEFTLTEDLPFDNK